MMFSFCTLVNSGPASAEDRLQEEITTQKVVEEAVVSAADARTQTALEDAQSDPLARALLAYIQQAQAVLRSQAF